MISSYAITLPHMHHNICSTLFNSCWYMTPRSFEKKSIVRAARAIRMSAKAEERSQGAAQKANTQMPMTIMTAEAMIGCGYRLVKKPNYVLADM